MQHVALLPMSRACPICGKLLRSGSADAIAAHQRESQSCRPVAGRNESATVKALDERLASVIAEGKAEGGGSGSFEQSQRIEAERAEIERQIKQARRQQKDDKLAIKELASKSMSTASWTQSVLEGVDARYTKASDSGVEARLAAETVGLVTADAFRQKRSTLEADDVAKRRREEDEERNAAGVERKRKAARKAKREREERKGLSFDVEDE